MGEEIGKAVAGRRCYRSRSGRDGKMEGKDRTAGEGMNVSESEKWNGKERQWGERIGRTSTGGRCYRIHSRYGKLEGKDRPVGEEINVSETVKWNGREGRWGGRNGECRYWKTLLQITFWKGGEKDGIVDGRIGVLEMGKWKGRESYDSELKNRSIRDGKMKGKGKMGQ